ncbi:hypothetical protein QQ045_000977 [Rhodiola kirilowii]
MLAVFNKSVARIHRAMKNPDSAPVSGTQTDCFLARELLVFYPHTTTFNSGASGYMVIDDNPDQERQVACHGDVFVLFYGMLKNTEKLIKHLEISGTHRDTHLISEIYKIWRDESTHIVDSPLGELEGQFSFILYDMSCDYVAIGTVSEP